MPVDGDIILKAGLDTAGVTKSIQNMISAVILDKENKEIDKENYTINYSEEKIGSIKMEISIFLAGNGYNFEFYFNNEIKNG
jgi:hypothetical protein